MAHTPAAIMACKATIIKLVGRLLVLLESSLSDYSYIDPYFGYVRYLEDNAPHHNQQKD